MRGGSFLGAVGALSWGLASMAAPPLHDPKGSPGPAPVPLASDARSMVQRNVSALDDRRAKVRERAVENLSMVLECDPRLGPWTVWRLSTIPEAQVPTTLRARAAAAPVPDAAAVGDPHSYREALTLLERARVPVTDCLILLDGDARVSGPSPERAALKGCFEERLRDQASHVSAGDPDRAGNPRRWWIRMRQAPFALRIEAPERGAPVLALEGEPTPGAARKRFFEIRLGKRCLTYSTLGWRRLSSPERGSP